MIATLSRVIKESTPLGKQTKLLTKGQIFSLFVVILFIYLITLGLSLFILNNLSNRSGSSYRVSLQSRFGFGTEPSSLTIIVGLLIALALFLISNLLLSQDTELRLTKVFSQLMLPSSILFAVVMSQFFLGKIDLRSSGFSISSTLEQVWFGNFWTRLFSFGISIPLVLFIVLIIRKNKNLEAPNSVLITFLPWWIPLVVDFSFLISSKLNSVALNRFLLWFTLMFLVALLLGYCFTEYKRLSNRILIALTVFLVTFFALYLRRPKQVITWRPNLIMEDITPDRFLIFSAVVALVMSLSLLSFNRFLIAIPLITAGLWSLFSVPFTTLVVSSMDNFHFGEFVGSWFNTSESGLIPYRDIEYPRGLLINYIPSSFANFLSGGFPETFNYWFVFLSLVLGVCFAFVMRNFLPLPLIFVLIMILPKANGYNEIDLLMLLTLVKFIEGLFNRKFRLITSYLIIPVSIFWILLAPGQGVIFLLLLSLAFFISHFSSFKEFYQIQFSKPVLLYFSGILLVMFLANQILFPAIEWVIRNGRLNNQLFGDGWLNQALSPQDFPISLRFIVLLVAPLLLVFTLVYFSHLDMVGRGIAIIAIVYLVIISGRWFGRVDVNTLSRIGMGFLITLIVLVLPLLYRLPSRDGRFAFLPFPVFGLVFVFALTLNPFNVNSFVPYQPANILNDQNYKPMLERGLSYARISSLSQSLFGSETRMLNLTGGNAIDQYIRIPGVGGIHSAYVVTNDAQEIDWLKRLQKIDPNFILGGYGSLGSAAFDGSGMGGRAPLVLSWVISNYTLSDCGDFIVGVKNSAAEDLQSRLSSSGCNYPSTTEQKLLLWNKMDATPSDLGASFLSWPAPRVEDLDLTQGGGKSVQVQTNRPSDRIGFNVECSSRQIVQFTIKSVSSLDPLSFSFNAEVESGQYSFKPSVFPISTLLGGSFILTLGDASCEFS
jgi:hypothetical protein